MKCVGVIFQVRLPRQQLYVCRVSPKTTIQQILDQVCREKGYDPARYEVRKTGIIPFYNKHLIFKIYRYSDEFSYKLILKSKLVGVLDASGILSIFRNWLKSTSVKKAFKISINDQKFGVGTIFEKTKPMQNI